MVVSCIIILEKITKIRQILPVDIQTCQRPNNKSSRRILTSTNSMHIYQRSSKSHDTSESRNPTMQALTKAIETGDWSTREVQN
jgi:hypothetical protein